MALELLTSSFVGVKPLDIFNAAPVCGDTIRSAEAKT